MGSERSRIATSSYVSTGLDTKTRKCVSVAKSFMDQFEKNSSNEFL